MEKLDFGVEVALIGPNPYQARKEPNPDEIQHLADSMKKVGLLNPIMIRPMGQGFEEEAGKLPDIDFPATFVSLSWKREVVSKWTTSVSLFLGYGGFGYGWS